ncbi:SGNH/GDSL hydrolase family protein [Cereibacter changlensis]|uniref:SGNH/GDSL hydrolase family protein n=1 Tax=Cereibacter changlensis TaxID=402884 RepID=UPI0040342CA7
MVQKLVTRLPSARIMLMTTPYGELPGRLMDGSGWTSAKVNLVNLTTRDYAEAVRVMGKRWGLPVIDLGECGWNETNIATFMKADGGFLHPNAAGGDRIASAAIGKLKALAPVS